MVELLGRWGTIWVSGEDLGMVSFGFINVDPDEPPQPLDCKTSSHMGVDISSGTTLALRRSRVTLP